MDMGYYGQLLISCRALEVSRAPEGKVGKFAECYWISGQKRVTFEEFIPLYHSHSKKKGGGNFESFAEGFRIFDREGDGMVSVAEIRHLLTSLGKQDSVLNLFHADVPFLISIPPANAKKRQVFRRFQGRG